MHLYLPRRHRRKLLFPPGLLALAGLLWLGSVALGTRQDKLSPRYVIQFLMPVRPVYRDSNTPTFRFEVPIPDKVCKSCSWHDAYLTGRPEADRREQLRIAHDMRDIIADTMHAGGIRVHFAPTAHYKSLVFMLNLMIEKDVRKYWFDITRSPATFYAITDAYKPGEVRGPYSCLLCNDVMSYIPTPLPLWARLRNQAIEFGSLTWLKPLQQPEWRVSLWLLALIAALSSWRMARAWLAA